MAVGWSLLYNLVLYSLCSLLTATPLVDQPITSLASSADTSIGEILCSLTNEFMCASSFWNKIGDSHDFISFWRMLRGRQRFQFARLFTFSKNCNGVVKGRLASSLKEIGLESHKNESRDVLLDIRNLKRLLQCGNGISRYAQVRVKRNTAQNLNFTTTASTFCWPFWRGDGYCDLGCNTEEYNYDDGDCCYETCTQKIRRYPCGFTGFQCKHNTNNAPSWVNDIKFCFRWRANGDGSQCDTAGKGKICAPLGSMTKFYYDDTDERNGGCVLSWKIEAMSAPEWFWTRLQLCLYSYSDGDMFQCNYGSTNNIRCRRANDWVHYVDDTDNRQGGCILRWKVLYLGMVYCSSSIILILILVDQTFFYSTGIGTRRFRSKKEIYNTLNSIHIP